MFLRSLILCSVVALVAQGCTYQCDQFVWYEDSGVSFVESASLKLAAWSADAGAAYDEGFEDQKVSWAGDIYPQYCFFGQSDACISFAGGPVTVAFQCPPDAGLFDLATLSATACDAATCTPLGGTLDVHSYVPDCVLDGGSFDADINLPPVSSGPGPFISGSGHLSYRWVLYPESCSSFSFPVGGG